MAISRRLDREVQRWTQRDGEGDQEWESRAYRGAMSAALQLLVTSKLLGWGSGQPVPDAQEHLAVMAERHGDFFEYKRPPPPPRGRIARKSLQAGLVRSVFDRDGWECRECGSHRELTVDHITPLVLGGSDDPENLQTLCKSCNSRKGARV